jgi:hypothetical protein
MFQFGALLRSGESRNSKLIYSHFLTPEFSELDIFSVLLLPSLSADGCKNHISMLGVIPS